MLSFEEFTDALYKAGWRADCDAQHTEVVAVYDEMVSESRKAEQITALRQQLAEAQNDAEQYTSAWSHSCNVLTMEIELWISRCPHCGKPAPIDAAIAAGKEKS